MNNKVIKEDEKRKIKNIEVAVLKKTNNRLGKKLLKGYKKRGENAYVFPNC